jgi:hypothetical protein
MSCTPPGPVIEEPWHRMPRRGVDPNTRPTGEVSPAAGELERRRRSSGVGGVFDYSLVIKVVRPDDPGPAPAPYRPRRLRYAAADSRVRAGAIAGGRGE